MPFVSCLGVSSKRIFIVLAEPARKGGPKLTPFFPSNFQATCPQLVELRSIWRIFGGGIWMAQDGTGWNTGRYQHVLVSLLCRWTIEVLASSGAACGEWWMARFSIGFVEQLSTGQSSGRSEQDSFSVIVVSQPSSQRPIVEHRVSLSKPTTACMLLDAAAEKAQVERIWTRNNEQNRVLDRRDQKDKHTWQAITSSQVIKQIRILCEMCKDIFALVESWRMDGYGSFRRTTLGLMKNSDFWQQWIEWHS